MHTCSQALETAIITAQDVKKQEQSAFVMNVSMFVLLTHDDRLSSQSYIVKEK